MLPDFNKSAVSPNLYHQLQNDKRNLEIVNSNLIAQVEANNDMIERLN